MLLEVKSLDEMSLYQKSQQFDSESSIFYRSRQSNSNIGEVIFPQDLMYIDDGDNNSNNGGGNDFPETPDDHHHSGSGHLRPFLIPSM
jgi:hypothetical protein